MQRPAQALKPPLLWPATSTPPDEADAIKALHASLYAVSAGVDAWRAAFALFTFAESKPANVHYQTAWHWKFIACHECVMVIHHLTASMGEIQGRKVRACPSLASHIDVDGLRAARKVIRTEFADVNALRDAIAHSGINGLRPETHAPGGRFGLTGFHTPNRFGAPFEGTMRHLEISERSLQMLEAAAQQFLDAFEPAARWLEEMGHAE